jgi:excisionase family DNA binding protein
MSDVEFNSRLLTVKEIANILSVPITWVYERARLNGEDQIPHRKLGKYLRFDRQEVLDWAGGMRRG